MGVYLMSVPCLAAEEYLTAVRAGTVPVTYLTVRSWQQRYYRWICPLH